MAKHLAIELYHGRKNPQQDMGEWGTQGPVFIDIEYFHTAYLSNPNLGGDIDFLTEVDGLIFYDNVFYGDLYVFQYDDEDHADVEIYGPRIQQYDHMKATHKHIKQILGVEDPSQAVPTPNPSETKEDHRIKYVAGVDFGHKNDKSVVCFFKLDGAGKATPLVHEPDALLFLDDREDPNPLCGCPKCGHIGRLMDDFSLLKAGFNGIEEGDKEDLDLQECGACSARLEWD